jgi:eukaryotic-like serine/threonine-protein kinase
MICARCHRTFDEPDARACPFDGETLTDKTELELIGAEPTPDVGVVYSKCWIVRGQLGGGGMAQIYLAENAFTKQAVAIKVLGGGEAKHDNLRERFFREVRTIDGLRHPNIVQLLDAGARKDGAPYLVMEYLFGESLGDRLRRQPQLEVSEALWIARQVASALAAAHAAGVIHRDVKPDNIFLVGEVGHPYAVKLVDFGLSRMQGLSALTAMGVTVGTLEYMAPEQTVRDATGPRSDMYALGVVLYRMVTGSLPFRGQDAELLAQHLISPPPPPSELVPDLDPRLEAVILTALRKLPRNRYPAMEDFLEDIERLLGTRPGQLNAGTTWEPDVYAPHSPYARTIAGVFYKKLGLEAPVWE